MASQIRGSIVRHVSNNWERFQPFTQDRSGAVYGSKSKYVAEMSCNGTYGTTCELMAAGELFPFEFQVFQDGNFIAGFGEAQQGVKLIRFSGNFNEGHFDVLIPLADLNNQNDLLTFHAGKIEESPTFTESAVCVQLTPQSQSQFTAIDCVEKWQIITSNEAQILCKIVNIPGDGACLFSSLSYLVNGNVVMASQIRASIVRHVSDNWERFQPFTQDRSKAVYCSKRRYVTEMSCHGTYGTTCELMAAGELFPFEFQVFQDGTFIAGFGEARQGVKIIQFSGNFNEGHFDVLVPLVNLNNKKDLFTPHAGKIEASPTFTDSAVNVQLNSQSQSQFTAIDFVEKSLAYSEQKECESFFSGIQRQHQISVFVDESPTYTQCAPFSDVSHNQIPSFGSEQSATFTEPENDDSDLSNLRSPTQRTPELSPHESAIVRPVKEKIGNKRRKRFTDLIRKKQLRKSASKYAKNKPNVNKSAVKKYAEAHIEAHRGAVSRYSKSHPEVHREAVSRYSQSHPEVHREAVSRYSQSHPEVNREAVKHYASNNPHINQKSAAKYYANKLLSWTNKHLSGFKYEPEIDYSKDKVVELGCRHPCTWCRALKWEDEPPGMCCGSGKVQLPTLETYPEPLHSLLTHQHPMSEHFLNSSRKYNACFQMTSFGAKVMNEGNYMPTFKVQGQVYHRIGCLMAGPQKQPAFLQIYFVGDDDYEREIRCGILPGVKPELVGQLQKLLHEHNAYIIDFKAAVESVPPSQNDFQVVINADRKPPSEHRGRFNAPSTKEVAVVIVGQDFEKRDIILHSRDNRLIRISETHRAYDALQYPLIFCRGEDGYYIRIPQQDAITKAPLNKTVSAADFYSYRIMERDDKECYLLLFRNLYNQYLVDMYAKIETERLNFFRHNQTRLRSEEYVHLKDAMSRSDGNLTDLGKMVILPSSFTGGPRYMHERTQDAMTYVRLFGRPDLFITFTCNPKWGEILVLLKEGQKSQDRPDLTARVFQLKVKQMMKLLIKGSIFGTTRCHMYSIEWQKRGLPHVHILLWLEDKLRPESIDKLISAEFPDPNQDQALYQIVKTAMVHGPCGSLNSKSPCMKDGACTKKYPRPFVRETQTGEDGYPKYRRRSQADGGFTAEVRGVELDNRWVVPYNPVLSRTFSAHINVEYCNSVKSIKYICKYVNKGSDQAAFTVEDQDEVKKYEAGRYISSSEAVWRILCFSIHDRFPPVMHLAVHLENGQRIYFLESNVKDRINNPPKTTLLAFFELCRKDNFARTLLYCEVPTYYIWKDNTFFRRKRGTSVSGYPGVKKDKVLGRVYTVHPSNSECFYLRLLLHKIRGPTSFTALKTVEGVVQLTYQAACRKLGLLADDFHWDRTLSEASVSDSPSKIRELFATMLVFCQVGDPLILWEKHRYSLSEDYIRHIERKFGDAQSFIEVNDAYNRCLIDLEDLVLNMSGKALYQFGLPAPSREIESGLDNRQYLNEIAFDAVQLTESVAVNVPKLNQEQRDAYDEIIHSIDCNCGKLFFLDAPGGTGKTFLLNLLLATIRRVKNIAVAVASSGIAATLLDGGKTAHSAFKLPLNLNSCESTLCNIPKQSNMARVLKEAKLIVWDECTMAHKGGVEALDRTLQDIRAQNRLMGGLTVLLSGDFRQTLPVIPRGTRADEVKACLKSSILWHHVSVLSLRVNMRVHLYREPWAEEFSELLLDIGDGNIFEEDGRITIPSTLCDVVEDLDSLTNRIYSNINQADVTFLRERAILTPRNDSANNINNYLLEKLITEEVTYKSVDEVLEVEEAVHYPVEFLNSLDPPGLPPHVLHLKVGAPIMLLRNLQPPKLCNGTRLQVRQLQKNVIEATIFTGVNQGETVFIPRIPLMPSDYHFEFKRLQFPVKVCYAMTINKAQGQTLKVAGVDLRKDCFSHGQLYVACSRVSSPENLIILQPTNKTRNVVYKEVLQTYNNRM